MICNAMVNIGIYIHKGNWKTYRVNKDEVVLNFGNWIIGIETIRKSSTPVSQYLYSPHKYLINIRIFYRRSLRDCGKLRHKCKFSLLTHLNSATRMENTVRVCKTLQILLILNLWAKVSWIQISSYRVFI